jgi:hypothetical protein
LADRLHRQSEEQVPHGGVACHRHFADPPAVARKGFDGVREIPEQRALQELAAVLPVEDDARHHAAAGEALRAEGLRGGRAARFQVHQAGHHGRRATSTATP